MEHERKWFSLGRLSLTIGLLIILFAVIVGEIALFISGPAIRYDDKIAAQEAVILRDYSIQQLHRHVFAYIVYSGQDDEKYYWFNENGELLTWRSLNDIDMEKAKAISVETYQMQDCTIALGYGYEKPVYILEDQTSEVYLDIDTMEQVFIRKKGL